MGSKKKAKPVKPAKKAAKKKSPAKKVQGLTIVNLKVNTKDRKVLTSRAKRFAKGNTSAWLRHAGAKYVPKKGEVISLTNYK